MFFSREFLSYILKMMTTVTVVTSLPKSLLSGAIRKIRDSFHPVMMRLLMFNESLNYPLRIDSTESEIEIRQVEVAFHF